MKQIVKEIEGIALRYIKAPGVPTPNEWNNVGGLQPAWRSLGTTAQDWYMQDELDVAGWTKDDLTMFLRAAEVQQDGFYIMDTLNNLSTPGQPNTEIHREYIIEWFALTSYPIDMITWYTTLQDKTATGLIHYAPNFAEQLTSFDNVIVGALRYHQYNQNINTPDFNALQLTQSHSFGSGSASASDKLYLYRFISLPKPNDSPEIDDGLATMTIPNLRFILNADLDKEAEYQYIMRLKRSLDLYQEGL